VGDNGFNDRFDPEAEREVDEIDDLETHARVMPLFDKSNLLDQAPKQATIEAYTEAPQDWFEPVTGSQAIVFDTLTDGRDTTFARAGVQKFGVQQATDIELEAGDTATINGTFEIIGFDANSDNFEQLGYVPTASGGPQIGDIFTVQVLATGSTVDLGAPYGVQTLGVLYGAQRLRQVRTFQAIAAQSGYAADKILGLCYGASKITDPDGETMEIIMEKGPSDVSPAVIEQRLPTGDSGAISAFWGRGDADFDGKNWDPLDGDDDTTNFRLSMRRKPPGT
jgi:hypothetical protein